MDFLRGHFYKLLKKLKQLNNIPKNIILFVWIVHDE